MSRGRGRREKISDSKKTHDVRLPPALQQELQGGPAEPPEPRRVGPRVAVDAAVGELAVGGLDEEGAEPLDDAGGNLRRFFFCLGLFFE